MKKTTFLTLACLFVLFGNFAYPQNWKPVLTDKTQYFIGPDSAGVDSIIWGFKTYFEGVNGVDSSFTFNRIWRNVYPGMTPFLAVCPSGSAWIQYHKYLFFIYDRENVGGDGMIRKPGGEFWFHGPQSDTIKFKTQLPVGARWEFRPGTLDSAAIVSRTTAMVYGVMDSILEISTDQGGRYVLSKDHGLLDWPYFYPLMKRSGFVLQGGGSLFGIEEDGFGRHIPRYADF